MSAQQQAKPKRKAFVKLVVECDDDGRVLPAHMAGQVYWVFTAEAPYTYVCCGSSPGEAMDIARRDYDCYFDGDLEDVPIVRPKSKP